jgi:hypothetical protein
MNEELRILCEQDQADRRGRGIAEGGIERDRLRRRRVEELIEGGALQDAKDYFHAALVYQHGEQLEDYWRAYDLARKADALGFRTNLAACAYDRWLMNQGKPQRFGTQSRTINGRYTMWDVDPATTDAERAEWNTPTLAELRRRVDELNRS